MRVATDDELPLSEVHPIGRSLGGRPSAHFEPNRTCASDGCSTRLSIYNGAATCWAHTEARPVPLTVRRSRRVA
jgi:hypothetical protein